MKRRHDRHKKNLQGFTLLEILLAIVILGTVLSTVFASYSRTFQIINDVETQLDVYQMARTALDRIVEDISSVYVSQQSFKSNPDDPYPLWHLFEGEDSGIGGESADKLRFSSRAHISFREEDETGVTALISYTVEEREESGPLVLLRGDRILLENNPDKPLDVEPLGFPICEGLASVEFKYFDDEGDEQDKWSFSEERTLPKRVLITLAFVHPDEPESRYTFSTSVAIPITGPVEKTE